jgi:hypothetical protein
MVHSAVHLQHTSDVPTVEIPDATSAVPPVDTSVVPLVDTSGVPPEATSAVPSADTSAVPFGVSLDVKAQAPTVVTPEVFPSVDNAADPPADTGVVPPAQPFSSSPIVIHPGATLEVLPSVNPVGIISMTLWVPCVLYIIL